MKRIIFLLASILSLASLDARAAIVTVSVTFTNFLGPLQTNTFTRNGTTVTYTNQPLNSATWILTNNAKFAATGLWNHLGANMPMWYSRMSNATNVTITGQDVQFSIGWAGFPQYALLTTNTGGGGTNSHFLILSGDWTAPQKFQPYETNKTNDASELLNLMKTYALEAARLRFFSNEHMKAVRIVDASSTNHFITNSPSIQTTNLATAKLTATEGEITVNVTNAPWIKGDSNRFHTVIVSGAIVATNLSAPGTGSQSEKLGAGSIASGSVSLAIGVSSEATNNSATALGSSAKAYAPSSLAVGPEAEAQEFGASGVALGAAAIVRATNGIAIGTGSTVAADHANSVAIGTSVTTTETNQLRVGLNTHKVSVPGELQADGTAKIANAVRYAQSGPWTFTEGAYAGMTGGSNNVVAISTNAWTRISGHVSACNLNSLRQGAAGGGDGLPMSGRRHGIVNGGSFDITLIDTLSDGFETLDTNEMDLGGVNITLAPKDRAEFIYNASSARWEILFPKPPTNLVVKSTGDFSGAETTNVIAFNAQQIRRMTNAMTTNTTFILSNILAGSSVELFLTGANGGVIASNYTFKLLTNSLPTASRITWKTNGVALTNGTYDYAVPSNAFARVVLTAPFATNVYAEYKVGP